MNDRGRGVLRNNQIFPSNTIPSFFTRSFSSDKKNQSIKENENGEKLNGKENLNGVSEGNNPVLSPFFFWDLICIQVPSINNPPEPHQLPQIT